MKRSLVLFFLFSLCFSATAEERTVTILVPKSTSSIPFLELELRDSRDDVIPDAGIEVEFFANHAQALARLLNGDVSLLYTGSSVGWENHLNGGPVVMIRTGVWGVSSIIGTDEAYAGIGDLKNKTIALPFPGAPLDLQMRYIFEENGIDPEEDIRIVYSPFPQTAGQILSGQVDAAPLPEPLATTLVTGKGLERYVKLQDLWADVQDGDPLSPQVALFTTKGALSEVEDLLPTLISEWTAASKYVGNSPESAAQDHAEALGYKLKIVSSAIDNTIFLVTDHEENKTRVLEYIELLYEDEGKELPEEAFFVDVR